MQPIAKILLFTASVITGPVAYAQTEAAIVDTFREGETIIIVTIKDGIVSHRIVRRSIKTTSGGPPPPVSPIPPGNSGLTAFVENAAKAVDHADKDEINSELAHVYTSVANQISDGKIISPQVAADVMKEAVRIYLQSARKTDAWDKLQSDIQDQLTQRNLRTVDDVETAIREIAAGFSQSSTAALNPKRIRVILKLVMAILSKDPVSVVAVIIELVEMIRSGRGG